MENVKNIGGSFRETVKTLKDKKLALVLAAVLTLSACAEKAKTWSGEQLKNFKERPNVEAMEREMIDVKDVESMVNTIHDFDEYFNKNGNGRVDLTTAEMRKSYDENPRLVDKAGKRYPYVYEATLLEKDTVLVEYMNPMLRKVDDEMNTPGITMYDTVYKIIKDEKTNRYMLVIKQGNLLASKEKGGEEPLRETGIDQETGVITYVTDHGYGGSNEGFELEPDKDGNLQVVQGKFYKDKLGKGIADIAVREMKDLSQKLKQEKH